MTMADKIMIMEAGIIQQIGSPGEVFDYPINLFVADFIGTPSINLLPGKMAVSKGNAFLDGGTFTLPLPANIQAKPGQALVYGIRPQHIKLVTDPADADADTVDATLLLCETTGTESQLSFDFGGQTLTVVNQGRFNIPVDTKCRLRVDVQRVHLFDGESKKRLDLPVDPTR
jgi:multiple sugar transport system ATP-binding protein